MLPPPAPMVCTSIIGTMTGKPAILVSRAEACVIPRAVTMPMSALVPPTSNVMRFSRLLRRPTHSPPSTPAASPDKPFRNHLAMASPHQGLSLPGYVLHDGIILRPLVAPNMNDVAITLGSDHAGARTFVFQHGIGRNGGAVK